VRGGCLFWAVVAVLFVPYGLYQTAIRQGQIERLDPIGAGLVAGIYVIIAIFIARLVVDAVKGWRWRKNLAKADAAQSAPAREPAPTNSQPSVFNPLKWDKRHQVAGITAMVIGLVLALVVGYQWGDPGYQLSDWLFYVGSADFGYQAPECWPWALLGIFVGGGLFYVWRLSARAD
jgi:hypothetical protein